MTTPSSLESIFFGCLGKAPDERAAFLAHACGGDVELQRRVQRMLQAQGSSFLEQAAFVPELVAEPPVTADGAGQRIGAYRLVEQLGEGGMGTVWRAEQLEPVQREVALKLIKAGMDSQQVISRFEAERQALALMDHPNIARVLDGGTDAAGRPYFVMDLFAGLPITRFCDEQRMALRPRLELFVQVCGAIQHAHQKGVIHRDIKPSNVLVALQDGKVVPKVIDFGIAKAIERKLTDQTVFTQQGGFVGTLEFMSPEQAARSAGGVDTRSDIYSLGVLLFELLTGSTPLSRLHVEQASYGDILRAITDGETPKPSTRLGEPGTDLATVSAQRCAEPGRLASMVRGDLDWIVVKALEKDRNRRYSTAAAFAQDVQRFIAHEPVLACPPSAAYRLRKFARRNRGALAAGCVLAAALFVAIGGIGWALRDRAAQTAETERITQERRSRATASVQELLAVADRQLAAQEWSAALATVRRADAAATSGEADAAVARHVRTLLLGLEFVERLDRIRSRRATWVDGRLDSASAEHDYAQAFREYGVELEEAPVAEAVVRLRAVPALVIPLAAGLDDWRRQHLLVKKSSEAWYRFEEVANAVDPEPVRVLIRSAAGKRTAEAVEQLKTLADTIDVQTQHPVTLMNLAGCLEAADPVLALRVMRDAQAAFPGDFWLNFELGSALNEQRDHESALRFYTAAVAIRPDSAAAHNNLGHALRCTRKTDEALACLRRAVALDPALAVPLVGLSSVMYERGKKDEALALLRRAVELQATCAPAWVGFGTIQLEDLQLAEAADSFQRALAADPQNPHALSGYGNTLRAQGNVDEAMVMCRRAVESDPGCAGAWIALGNTLAVKNDTAGTVDAFRKASELEPHNAVALGNLGNSLLTLDDAAKVDEAVALCRRCVELDPLYARGHACLGNTLMRKQLLDEAMAAYRRAVELDPRLVSVWVNLGRMLWSQKQGDEAIAAYRKAVELRPDDADAWQGIASIHYSKNQFAEAAIAWRRVVDLVPRNADALHVLASALTKLRKFDEALDAYQRAAEVEPGNAMRHLAVGSALHARRRFDEAAAAYRKAIEVDAKFSMAYGVLGDVLHLQHEDEEAVVAYRQAVTIDPKFSAAWQGLGIALRSLGEFAEAIAALERAVGLDAADAKAATNLALLLATCPDTKLRNAERAVQLARQAIDVEPDDVGHCRILGVALYRAGNWREALDALQVAMDLGRGGNALDWLYCAMAHGQLGDGEKGRSYYTRAIDWIAAAKSGGDGLRELQLEAAALLGVEVAPR